MRNTKDVSCGESGRQLRHRDREHAEDAREFDSFPGLATLPFLRAISKSGMMPDGVYSSGQMARETQFRKPDSHSLELPFTIPSFGM